MAVSLAGKARVNSISPGWIETAGYHEGTATPEHSEQDKKQHPAGRIGAPEDIAEMVLFLCSDKAGFITGENITIDGGMSRLMVYHDDHSWKLE
jgi:NAD(P)-dependent dehydrogenase (short-subunit alcohol dehydrogenase family)